MKSQAHGSMVISRRRRLLPVIHWIVVFILSLASSTLSRAAEADIQITGNYELVVACAETHHELTSYVVVPGADKFSGIRHLLNISPEMQKNLRPGTKIRIVGKKQMAVKKMITKGELRKHMARYIEQGIDLPYQSKEMPSIIDSIIKQKANKDVQAKADKDLSKHDHGEVELKPMADDKETIEVKTMEHIAVSKIDIVP